jgi:oxygen-independent coproporphyrinogen-3 oxidase
MIELIKKYLKNSLIPEFNKEPVFSFPSDNRIGLYIHYAFCKHICMFCPYHKIQYDESIVREYTDFIIKEFELHDLKSFTSLYIGGGTPSNDKYFLERILSFFKDFIKNEISLEIHPLDATYDNIEFYKSNGINFVSLGVQSFDDEFLRFIGRNHGGFDNEIALENIMNAKFDFVDVDLIFKPEKSFENLKKDFTSAAKYSPEQISVYPLMRFSYTGLGKTKNIPSREKEYFRKLDKVASDLGYERDTLWTYTLKNKTGKFSSVGREFYLGLGMSSSSFSGNVFSTNTFSYEKYKGYILKGKMPVDSVYFFDDYQGALFYSFWALYNRKLEMKNIEKFFPGGYNKILIVMKFLKSLKYLEGSGDRYCVTDKGLEMLLELEEWLTYEFIDPLWSRLRASAKKSQLGEISSPTDNEVY